MVQSFRQITPELAGRLRLVMTDVDGTLVLAGDALSPEVVEAVHQLEKLGIRVGLVSGRTLPKLESMAATLGITGPLIAENGGVAKLAPAGEIVDLGYSREPALVTLARLKEAFPGAIREREDNSERQVDVVFWADGVELKDLKPHLGDTHLLDSGYIMHIMHKGISKGLTLKTLLALSEGEFNPASVVIFGDSLTDLSLFQLFPHSVLIPNPKLTEEHGTVLGRLAGYCSELECGQGFAEVARHIAQLRRGAR